MELNDILKIGEVSEVAGKTIKAGIYADKNTEYLNFNGDLVKNVSIGSFVLIRKGYSNIIGKVEGEYIRETTHNVEFFEKGDAISRTIGISILGAIEKDKFIHGLTNLPMIGNYVYVVTENIVSQIFAKETNDKLVLGTLIGYEGYPFEVGVQELICSHIGVFGNTGSGKSNTLAKIYRELIEKYKDNLKFLRNSKFVFFDFNGEYGNVFDKADKFILSTRKSISKYPINLSDITDCEFWSIILEATDKTQKPFIDRAIRKFIKILEGDFTISYDDLISLIFNASEKYVEVRSYIKEIFYIVNISKNFTGIENNLFYNSKQKAFYTLTDRYAQDYTINKDIIYNMAFERETNKLIDLTSLSIFDKFGLALYYQYCEELIKTFITKEHIGPLMARSRGRLSSLEKIFEIKDNDTLRETNIEIISLIGLTVDIRKIVPLIICKKLYNQKRESKKKVLNSSLHLIVDEAHNILSTSSIRESEEWKDYRLECFEEIIKEEENSELS